MSGEPRQRSMRRTVVVATLTERTMHAEARAGLRSEGLQARFAAIAQAAQIERVTHHDQTGEDEYHAAHFRRQPQAEERGGKP